MGAGSRGLGAMERLASAFLRCVLNKNFETVCACKDFVYTVLDWIKQVYHCRSMTFVLALAELNIW